MKQLSLWFALFSCAVLASLFPESCTKENGVLDQKSLPKTSALGVEKTSTITPPADPAIAYQSNGNLMVMNSDGSNQTVIVTGGISGGPSWSPDGHSIVFPGKIGGLSGLWIVDVSVVNGKSTSSNLHRILMNLAGDSPAEPRWSPLGDLIAFANGNGNIYVIPPAGGDPTIVYTSVAGRYAADPDWSPDASKLVFIERTPIISPNQTDLLVFDRNTTQVTTVVQLSSFLIFFPVWSRNGDRIAFHGFPYSGGATAIYTVTPTSNATPVNLFAGSYPTWSPNNSKLAFYGPAFHGDKAGVYSYDFSNGTRKRLADGTWPDWRRF